MHPLKDQREGVKYGRDVKYGVTPALKDPDYILLGGLSGIKIHVLISFTGIYKLCMEKYLLGQSLQGSTGKLVFIRYWSSNQVAGTYMRVFLLLTSLYLNY